MLDVTTYTTDFVTVSYAARMLELSEGAVRALADRGALRCTRLSSGGLRLFDRNDVLRLRAQRTAGASE